jgi:hypothetical protein
MAEKADGGSRNGAGTKDGCGSAGIGVRTGAVGARTEGWNRNFGGVGSKRGIGHDKGVRVITYRQPKGRMPLVGSDSVLFHSVYIVL